VPTLRPFGVAGTPWRRIPSRLAIAVAGVLPTTPMFQDFAYEVE
jgi:hypothetical protein